MWVLVTSCMHTLKKKVIKYNTHSEKFQQNTLKVETICREERHTEQQKNKKENTERGRVPN